MATVYLNEQQSIVKKRDEYLIVQYPDKHKKKEEVPLHNISQLVVIGDITLTTPAMHALLERKIEICFLSYYGHFRGRLSPPVTGNAALRQAQYRTHADPDKALAIARAFVRGKLANMRTMLLRFNRQASDEEITKAADDIQRMIQQTDQAAKIGSLLGIEGRGSAAYFGVFGKLLRDPWTFPRRQRRPPRDPVNSMLGLGYTLLGHQVASAIQIVGLDPYTGFLHQTRHGKAALVYDLIEEFRPIIVDSVILNLCNHHLLSTKDFQDELGVVHLKPEARKKFTTKLDDRLEEEITHPRFEYRTSYRRCIELQVRLLAKYLTGDIPTYPPFHVR